MYTVAQEGDACVVRVYHDFDFHSSASLACAIRLAASARPRVIVLAKAEFEGRVDILDLRPDYVSAFVATS